MDIRVPIGLLFTVLGALIAAWGALGGDAAKLPGRLGPGMSDLAMNLWWGLVLLGFGVFMLALAVCARCKAKSDDCGSGCDCDQ